MHRPLLGFLLWSVMGGSLLVASLAGRAASQAPAYEVWVANQGTDTILVYDGQTLARLAEFQVDDDGIPASSRPHMILFTPDGRYALVANVGAARDTANVLVIEAATRRVVARVPAGPSAHMAVASPDGRRVLVTNIGSHDVSEIMVEGQTFRAARRIPSGGIRPICAWFTRDGRTVYVTNGGDAARNILGNIAALDLTTGTARVLVPDVGYEACGTLLAADGRRMYTNVGFHPRNPEAKNDTFYVFDATTHALLHHQRLPIKDSHGLMETPDGTQVWIVGRQSNEVAILDARTYRLIAKVPAGDRPDLVVFSPDGSRAFFTLRGEPVTGDPHALRGSTPGLAVMSTASRRLLGVIPSGGGDPHGLAVRRTN
ncbi:MAG: hypothetical protein QN168_08450 [Armatimonadota bacterium]|nr:hypothetical protein [Armatimonadota bacterium]